MPLDLRRAKAEEFAALHAQPEILLLPNIWDVIGARILEDRGFPAVATASAAVAYSRGYEDGQVIKFEGLLDVLHRIAKSVTVPVTADVEGGYAEDPTELGENMARVIEGGVVGINFEDADLSNDSLRTAKAQCLRIKTIRQTADQAGVPLFINARTDIFLQRDAASLEERVKRTLARGKAYVQAGANGFYPIGLSDLSSLETIRREVDAPLNVLAAGPRPNLAELKSAGVNRVSFGPFLMRSVLAHACAIIDRLKLAGTSEMARMPVLSREELGRLLSPGTE